MKVEIESEEEGKLSFAVRGASPAFANMLRRFATGRVGTFAVQTVTIYENTSSIFSEYISHRIGLVPLKTPASAKGDDTVLLSLEATGPATVLSKELKGSGEKAKVALPNIPIVKLGDDQALRLEASVRLGTGREHGRHQPGLVSYEIAGDRIVFSVESFSQMPAREIILRAASIIEERCEELEEQLKQ